MKIAGIIITIIGLIGSVVSIINYISQTEQFGFLGINVTISEGSILPLVFSVVLFFIGLIMVAGASRGRRE